MTVSKSLGSKESSPMRGLEKDFSLKCAVLDKVSFFWEMVSST